MNAYKYRVNLKSLKKKKPNKFKEAKLYIKIISILFKLDRYCDQRSHVL